MCTFNSIFKRSKFKNLMSYIINEIGEDGENIEDYSRAIDQSYEDFFTNLEKLYPKADRNDNRLFDVVTDFSIIHDDIYFKAGALTGFQLYKEFEEHYKNHKDSDIPSLLKKQEDTNNEQQKQKTDSILDAFQTFRLDTAFETSIKDNENYQKLNEKTSQKIFRIDHIGLNREQWNVVDAALSACNERSTYFGDMAYHQGFKDAVKLLAEIFEC
ncbi:hypothetical protein [Candidatus Soleaferrea massiliensis]|uniref:hypothetical protein n=1 Tax=Candidatus Soleaferrea massiliensis TaxID=1470354 RepID=UPI000694B6B8|nr:hypothetical protein [Candidatus Soleaferrea massiliensis]